MFSGPVASERIESASSGSALTSALFPLLLYPNKSVSGRSSILVFSRKDR